MIIATMLISSNAIGQQAPSPDRTTLVSKCVENFSLGHAFHHMTTPGMRDKAIADRCQQEAEKYFPQSGTK